MAVRMAEAQRAPWRQRLEGLGFSAEDKGILISLLMAMKPVDREVTVDTDAQVAASTLKHMLLVAGGQKQESHGGCHGGSRRAEGSPVWRAHQAPARLVAFGSAKLLLADYCPNLEMRSFDVGMKELLRQLWKQPHTFQIRPENYRVPQDVLDYLLPLLQARMLGSNICSNNEASSYSSVLKIYEVIKLLLRCCPWTAQAKAEAQLEEPEQDRLKVVEVVEGGQEVTSRVVIEQKIAHEVWQQERGFVKGRVELQIVCNRADGKKYLLGACEAADKLNTPELLNAKLQQVAKEALAFVIKNAQQGLGSLPVKMLLFDGKRFMRIDLKLTSDYKQGMDLRKLAGNFSFSAAYPILWHRGATKEDAHDAVRLLLSWLWDGRWEELSKDLLVNALQAAEAQDAQAILDLEPHYAADGTKRRRTAQA